MRESAVQFLKLGDGADAPELTVFEKEADQVVEGLLRSGDHYAPIIDGVPVFLTGEMQPDLTKFCRKHDLTLPNMEGGSANGQQKTNVTFSDKWRRFKNYGLEESHQKILFEWYCKKFGLNSVDELDGFYNRFENTLECGPGSGFNSKFIAERISGTHIALDISDAAFTTYENTREIENCHVVQADLMAAPLADDFFDFVIADGVLHHTPDTRAAVEALYKKVKPGGVFFFYVYRRMGAARYFSDQHIRSEFMKLSPEECYAMCEGITELGRELSKLNVKVTLDKPIPVLGIPAGEHDVQRLVYYNWFKCYWNDAFDYETNNMVNYDWYHPHHAWQHTPEEVDSWLTELGVADRQFNDSNPNGISVLVRKPE